MIIAVTGANGFVGRHVVENLRRLGHRVVALVRRPNEMLPGIEARPYDIDAPPPSLAGIDAVVHAAFVRARPNERDASERNIRATMALCDNGRAAGARFVFLSSLSARPDARSAYGKHKFALEQRLAPLNALVIRPGLVVGDGGLVRGLYDAVCRGVVPLVDRGRQRVNVIGVDDVASAVDVALAAGLSGRLTVCAPESVSVAEMTASLSERFGRHPRLLSIPWPVAYAAAWTAERLRVTLPLTTENLLGMRADADELPSTTLLERGWRARSWNDLLPALSFGP